MTLFLEKMTKEFYFKYLKCQKNDILTLLKHFNIFERAQRRKAISDDLTLNSKLLKFSSTGWFSLTHTKKNVPWTGDLVAVIPFLLAVFFLTEKLF